jgi:glycosyltransferase involved in cell wall biosynthesis
MKVVVNSLAVPSCRQGGAGFYTSTLVDGLSRAQGIDCTVLASTQVAGELEELAPAATAIPVPARSMANPLKVANQAMAVRRPWTLDLGYGGTAPAADVTHWPIAFMNGPPPKHPSARVLTIHDLQHEYFPQFFSRHDRLLRRLRWRPSARAADHILTISEFSRRTICERFGVPENKITSVPLATRRTLAVDADHVTLPGGLDDLHAPWIIYPASPLPAKNHDLLLAALALHRERFSDDLRLILIGPTQHSWTSIEQTIFKRRLEGQVMRFGHVNEAMLTALYQRSTGLIFPSLFEGFGLPLLEAMSAGCPVAFSNAGSLPEIAASVGRVFSPNDIEQIADTLGWLVHLTPNERSRQIAGGRERAGTFSLQRLVDGTRTVYEQATSAKG